MIEPIVNIDAFIIERLKMASLLRLPFNHLMMGL